MSDQPVQVQTPLLPTAERIARYLGKIDGARQYSNHGGLVAHLEARLAKLVQGRPGTVVSAASGTAALIGAILATVGRANPSRPLCLSPGYAFIAAPLAAELCGYTVHLVDVDESTWALSPEALAKHPAISRAGLLLFVAPYGRRFSQRDWSVFTERTGVPVIIDAAAGIEALADDPADLVGPAPVVLSLHATKALSTGEGGAVVCEDAALAERVRSTLNFGFNETHEAIRAGLNGKMSEYHAAVGLAELDGWPEKIGSLRRIADVYRNAAARSGLTLHTAPAVSSTYVLFEAPSETAARDAADALAGAGIEARLWYGRGIHREPYFQQASSDSLATVDWIAPRLIGIPVASDLPDLEVERIVAILTGQGGGAVG